jgi:hypothetical protein
MESPHRVAMAQARRRKFLRFTQALPRIEASAKEIQHLQQLFKKPQKGKERSNAF